MRRAAHATIETMMRVSFDLDHTDWHGHPAETLWADPVPMLGPYAFRLQNSPFFKRGIAYLDIVDTTPTEGDGLFDFKRVIRRSGHSTYMILVKEDEPRFSLYCPASSRLHLRMGGARVHHRASETLCGRCPVIGRPRQGNADMATGPGCTRKDIGTVRKFGWALCTGYSTLDHPAPVAPSPLFP
jgi:hypothetical protein